MSSVTTAAPFPPFPPASLPPAAPFPSFPPAFPPALPAAAATAAASYSGSRKGREVRTQTQLGPPAQRETQTWVLMVRDRKQGSREARQGFHHDECRVRMGIGETLACVGLGEIRPSGLVVVPFPIRWVWGYGDGLVLRLLWVGLVAYRLGLNFSLAPNKPRSTRNLLKTPGLVCIYI